MRTRHRTTVVVLVMLAALGAVIEPAHAGRRGDPLYGDFNVDGIEDRAFLGSVDPDQCSVIVERGQRPDVFGPPVAYTYLRPGTGIRSCPDIGAAFDWDGSPGDELWIGWSEGPPPTIAYNRIILDDTTFRPVDTATAPVTPVFMGIADFTGTGRDAVYSYGWGGFASFLPDHPGTGQFGPVRWCSVDPPTSVALKDFNRNRAVDLVLAYTRGCDGGGNGVVVVLDDGTVRELEAGTARTWTAGVLYADDDRLPDIRTVDVASGERSHFLALGDGTFVEAPRANADAFYPTTDDKVLIDILANDHTTGASRITIMTPPAHGRVQVLSDRRIAYTPTVSPARTDRFVYRLTEDGRQSTTSVYVRYRE